MTATVLICEDEPIVALDLEMLVEGFGFQVMGPYASLRAAEAALAERTPDAAILDVRLTDGEVFPLADKLQAQKVGLVFHSGHAYEAEVSKSYPGCRSCQKPVATDRLKQALLSVTRDAVSDPC
ncbi:MULTISPECIES: response regulator [unclassified Roseivivax]|uniref:response regulator n=1 Tax=Roseivivax sp. GX 12232 TaxID=2900547 RepID=UPI001E46B664|nr:response regulator [Roseivivax sp. GX 12232]MCE0504072.1 response regulator [Roseivivax sp. GX 12232]